ncbi:deoxyribonuclease-2-like [Scomber japonicus]|uniref:deoxyribonuclease-2-like n=1 Tax=Scomber japonicus TaxID=13676 RepID=UPI002305382F|nr:deoxyribonuclease-2-like [Scomber japonicus]
MWRLVLVVSLLCCSSEASVSCKDEKGDEVDWYILYKTPKSLKDGLGYVYIYPDNNKVIQSGVNTKPINAADSFLAKTLHQLLHFDIKNPSETFGFISYNDQPPGCNAQPEKFGHSKGIVMVEKAKTGVWLIHSTPQFPFTRDPKTFYPPSGQTNAQIFMCVTFNYDQFKLIGKHLQYIRAFSFDHHIPEGLEEELRKAAEWRDWGEATPSGLYQQPHSKGGQMFYSITNHGPKNEKGDLYDTISKKLKIDLSDLKVQTWPSKDDVPDSDETVEGFVFSHTAAELHDFNLKTHSSRKQPVVDVVDVVGWCG